MTIFEWMKLKGWKVKQIKNKLQLTSSGVRLCRGVSHADPPPLFLPVPPFRKKMLWILIITLSWYKRHVKQWCKCKETSLSSKCNIFIPVRTDRGGKNWISIKIIIYTYNAFKSDWLWTQCFKYKWFFSQSSVSQILEILIHKNTQIILSKYH